MAEAREISYQPDTERTGVARPTGPNTNEEGQGEKGKRESSGVVGDTPLEQGLEQEECPTEGEQERTTPSPTNWLFERLCSRRSRQR
jgi:hypothetical protein